MIEAQGLNTTSNIVYLWELEQWGIARVRKVISVVLTVSTWILFVFSGLLGYPYLLLRSSDKLGFFTKWGNFFFHLWWILNYYKK